MNRYILTALMTGFCFACGLMILLQYTVGACFDIALMAWLAGIAMACAIFIIGIVVPDPTDYD